jgi:hypothetical protein
MKKTAIVDDRLIRLKKFLLSKTTFDLNFICHAERSARALVRKMIDLTYDVTDEVASEMIEKPKLNLAIADLKRETEEVLSSSTFLSTSEKRSARKVVSRFFYYLEAEIEYETSGIATKLASISGRTGSGEGDEGGSPEKRKAEEGAEDEPSPKRVRLRGREEKNSTSGEEEEESTVEIEETIDARLVDLVERTPEDVWWIVFYRLVSDSAFPSYEAFLKTPFLKYALGVSSGWADAIAKVIYDKRPSLIYSDPELAAIVDSRIKGGLKTLDLVPIHETVEKAGWYSPAKKRPTPTDDPSRIQGSYLSVVENELGKPLPDETGGDESFARGRTAWFENLQTLSFKQQSVYTERSAGWRMSGKKHPKIWEMENDFLKRLTNLTALEIDHITKPLEPTVTEKLVRLTALSLRGFRDKSQFRVSRTKPSDPHFYRTVEDEALHRLPNLADLKIEDVRGVTMKGLLTLTNLTALHHEGEFSAFPLKSADHAHEPYFRHMTRLKTLNLRYSYIAKWGNDRYDAIEDLINLPRLESLSITDFRTLTVDLLPSSLRKLSVNSGRGIFYFSRNPPGEERTMPNLEKLDISGLAPFATIGYDETDSSRFGRICPNLVSLKMQNQVDFRLIDDNVKSQLTRLTYEPDWIRFFPIPSFEDLAFDFSNLVRLEISSVGFPPDACSSRLTSLRRLSVNGRITSAALEGTNVSDEDLRDFLQEDLERSFRSLTGLTRLDLKNVPQFGTPLDFEGIRDLTNLTHLDMSGSPAKNEDVVPLWDRLTSLTLRSCPNIGNKSTESEKNDLKSPNLESVNKLTNLTSLVVWNGDEIDSEYWVDMECADFLPALKRLRIDGTVVMGLFPER